MTYIKFYDPYMGAYRDENTFPRVPAANIYEADNEYRIEMALPGADKKDITVRYEKGFLKVTVEKGKESDKLYDRHEFDYGGAERVFRTGEKVSTDHITAQYENGILILSLPKKEAFVKKPVQNIAIE